MSAKLKYLAHFLLVSISGVCAAAQPPPRNPSAEDLAACGACGGTVGLFVIIPIVLIVVNLALLIWVARDAKSRGMDSAVVWMMLVMLTSFIGLIIYIFARPQGNLVKCQQCGNSRLQASAKCPHCGNF